GPAHRGRDVAIPVRVIAFLARRGFGGGGWPRSATWAETLNASGGGPRYTPPGVMQAFGEFRAEALALCRARRAAARDDLVSRMVRAADGELPRSDDEIALESLLLLNGGSDTTRHVIAGATLALVQHPQALRPPRA